MRSYLHSPRPSGFLGSWVCAMPMHTCGRQIAIGTLPGKESLNNEGIPRERCPDSSTGSLGDLPLAVLSHDPDKPSSEMPPELAKSVKCREWAKCRKKWPTCPHAERRPSPGTAPTTSRMTGPTL